jgi:hypothetical protein
MNALFIPRIVYTPITRRLVLEALARAVPVAEHTPESACQRFNYSGPTLLEYSTGIRVTFRPSEILRDGLNYIADRLVSCLVNGRKEEFPAYHLCLDGQVRIDPDDVLYTQERLPLLDHRGRIPADYRIVIGVRHYRKGIGFDKASQLPTYNVELECQWSLEPDPRNTEVARG